MLEKEDKSNKDCAVYTNLPRVEEVQRREKKTKKRDARGKHKVSSLHSYHELL